MSWKVDPANSRIGFSVQHFKFTTVRGHFESFAGTLEMDEGNPPASFVEGTVETTSVKTGISPRDSNLRSKTFFDASRFPRMSFRSTRIEALPGGAFKVYGELTARDITREVVFDVANRGEMPAGGGGRRWAFEASTVLNRKDFDLQWHPLVETGGLAVGDEVKGTIEIQFVEE
jgi:polyisoprenoid-binding protein YceI